MECSAEDMLHGGESSSVLPSSPWASSSDSPTQFHGRSQLRSKCEPAPRTFPSELSSSQASGPLVSCGWREGDSQAAFSPNSAHSTDCARLRREALLLLSALRLETKRFATLLVRGLLYPVALCMLLSVITSSLVLFPASVSSLSSPSSISSASLTTVPVYSPPSQLRSFRSFSDDSRRLIKTLKDSGTFLWRLASSFTLVSAAALGYIAILTFLLAVAIRRGWHRPLYILVAVSSFLTVLLASGSVAWSVSCLASQRPQYGVDGVFSGQSGTPRSARKGVSNFGPLLPSLDFSFLRVDCVLVGLGVWNLSAAGAFGLLWLVPARVKKGILIAIAVSASLLLHGVLLRLGGTGEQDEGGRGSSLVTILLLGMAGWDAFAVLTPCGPLRWILDTLRTPNARPLPLLAYEVSASSLYAQSSRTESLRFFSVRHSVNSSPSSVERPASGMTAQQQAARRRPGLGSTSDVTRTEVICHDREEHDEASDSVDRRGRARPGESREEQLVSDASDRGYSTADNEAGVRSVQRPGGRRRRVGTPQDRETSLPRVGVVSADAESLVPRETGEDHEGAVRLLGNRRTNLGAGDTGASEETLLEPLSRGFLLLDDRALRARAAQVPRQEPRMTGPAAPSVLPDTSPSPAQNSRPSTSSLPAVRQQLLSPLVLSPSATSHPARHGQQNRRQRRDAAREALAVAATVRRLPPRRDVIAEVGVERSTEERSDERENRQAASEEQRTLAEEDRDETREIKAEIETTRRQLRQVRSGASHALLGLGDFVFYSLLASNVAGWSIEAACSSSFAVLAGLLVTSAATTFGRYPFLPALPLSILSGLGVAAGVYYLVQPQAACFMRAGIVI
ncbi:presenilin [Cystoisospora suis]|uniref:Presenilin n=1 Tax=Cystoisospora suis TaxID=483139 RepID=A0A2C6L2M3_9APIC|nr:presenilin [Cystoisospora suis]